MNQTVELGQLRSMLRRMLANRGMPVRVSPRLVLLLCAATMLLYPPCLLAIHNPKMMCSPPKPAARNQFPRVTGPSTARPPSSMKHNPMTGTIGTENDPPVMMPAP